MQIVQVPIGKLRFANYNPRKISEADMDALKKSVQRFGFVDPVVANRRSGEGWRPQDRQTVIVGGHQRVRAARELGFTHIPVVHVDLPPDEEKLLNLALNKIGGEFDLQKLAEVLHDLRAAQADLESSGFTQKEISKLIAQAERELASSLPPDAEDDIPPLPTTPRTKPGELIRMGPHRLLCGDATKPQDLKRLMGPARAGMIWTDPPYGIDYVGKTARAMTIQNDSEAGLDQLLKGAFSAANAVLSSGAPIYVAHPAGALSVPFVNAFQSVGWQVRQSLVWVKDSMVLGHGDYHYKHEAILYGYKPTKARLGRGGDGWYGGDDQTSVFEVPRPKASREHPTTKPLGLIEACIRNSSPREAVVLDPFGGSGSTLIAAHRLGRKGYLVEIDPAYCDVIRERYARLAGRAA
jgi:DNA modification methylase